MTEIRKVGRPSRSTDVRGQLIHQATKLFGAMPYDKVSIRLVAQKAQVDSAMVRYYFGNKEGLFEEMMREMARPMLDRMSLVMANADDKSLEEIMRSHYDSMLKMPRFTRLLSQAMLMPADDKSRQLVERVVKQVIKPSGDLMFARLVEQGIIRSDLDPNLCRLTFKSILLFPFIAPPALMAVLGYELNEEFIESLIEHNIQLLKGGMLMSVANLDEK